MKPVVDIQHQLDELARSDNEYMMVVMSILILFMQPAFSFLEAGFVRSKNVTSILMKNLLDFCLNGIIYWVVGFAFSFGQPSNSFIGYGYFLSIKMPDTDYVNWFFHFTYAATATSIVTGALAERCSFVGELIYSSVIIGFIYPIAAHWIWASDGWLRHIGVTYLSSGGPETFGSGVVHFLGGLCAVVGAKMIGPRIGKFTPTGAPRDIRGHSLMFVALGSTLMMIAMFGFIGAGVASQREPMYRMALAMVNGIVALSAGGLSTLIVVKLLYRKWSYCHTFNGLRAGLVAICAGPDVILPWGAFLVGIVAGSTYVLWCWLMKTHLKIDDALDAWAIHGNAGLIGILARPLLRRDGVLVTWDHDSFMHFAYSLVAALSIALWVLVLATVLFGILKLANCLRVGEEVELKGLDIFNHGEQAYPVAAYGHGWGYDEPGDDMSSFTPSSYGYYPPHPQQARNEEERLIARDYHVSDSVLGPSTSTTHHYGTTG